MALKDDLAAEADTILSQAWDLRDGTVVPETTDVALAGGGVKLDAVMLYADLADSTELATKFDRRVAAKVLKSFLAGSSRIIRSLDGSIRSFDGDRVMAVYLGERARSRAAITALKINWLVLNVLRPKIEAKYPVLKEGGFSLVHCTGVDVSEVLVVRAGIRNSNDLIWVGRAPNAAAKLSGLRESPFNSFVSGDVFSKLADDAKFGGDPKRAMWEQRTWTAVPEVPTVYRSSWTWTP